MPWLSAPSTSSGTTGPSTKAAASTREQTDLRAVAVGDHQLVARGDRRELRARVGDARALAVEVDGLPAPQQRVASERDHDPHRRSLAPSGARRRVRAGGDEPCSNGAVRRHRPSPTVSCRRARVWRAGALVTALAVASLVGGATGAAAADAARARLVGVAAATGRARWSADLGTGVGVLTVPFVQQGVVLATVRRCAATTDGYTRGDIGVRALDAATGSPRWSRADTSLAFPGSFGYRSRLPILIVASSDGVLRGVDARSGHVRWTHPATKKATTSPLVVDTGLQGTVGDLFVMTEGRVGETPTLAGYDLRTGKLRWRVEPGAAADGFAVSTAGELFTFPYQPGPLVLEQRSLATGAVTDRRTYGDRTFTLASTRLWIDAAHVVASESSSPGVVQVFDRATGAPAWSTTGTVAVVAGARVVTTGGVGPTVSAYDLATGAPAWQVEPAYVWDGDAGLTALGKGVVTRRSARLSVVATATGEERWTRARPPVVYGGTTAGTTVLDAPGCTLTPSTQTD